MRIFIDNHVHRHLQSSSVRRISKFTTDRQSTVDNLRAMVTYIGPSVDRVVAGKFNNCVGYDRSGKSLDMVLVVLQCHDHGWVIKTAYPIGESDVIRNRLKPIFIPIRWR